MRAFSGVDDLRAAVGEYVGTSAWRTVTQDEVDRFADVTDDHQWIHAAGERADAGPFGGPIVHGFLTLSLLPSMVREVLDLSAFSATVNYGLNKVRFPAPLPVGTSIRATVRILDVNDVPQGVLLVTEVVVEAEGQSKPVCVAEQLRLLVPSSTVSSAT